MGFPDPCIPLPVEADADEVSRLCLEHTARLRTWLDEQKSGVPKMLQYDGTFGATCRLYQAHPYSRFHTVKSNVRKTYLDSLKIIENTIGTMLVRNRTALDIQYYYDQWRKPAYDGGPERIDRAHDAVSMLKMVLRFCAALGHKDCAELLEKLANATSLVRFEKGAPREEQITYQQADAFVRAALDLGRRNVIPFERAVSMAIGVAAQFETLLRQKDIIGEWHKSQADAERAIAKGAAHLVEGGKVWTGWFCWERVPGWRWRLKTSKSNFRKSADHDLARYSLLFPLLELVPHDQRHGAIVKGENGLPIRARSYQRWFRQIARPAGIPDEVWNMDARAGGATEAYEAEVPIEHIQGAMTHSTANMTGRYIRSNGSDPSFAIVADARQKARPKGRKA